MNQFIFAATMFIAMLTCIHEKNDGSSDIILRIEETHVQIEKLMNQPEDLRQARLEWHRFWMVDQPSHMTPERIHAGNK
ncbi:MAG: hypothetical protein QM703_06690 [Gemmatales bacterium]